MKFDGDRVELTPPEAVYIEDICLYKPVDSVASVIKWKIKSGMLDWAQSVLPPGFAIIQGEARYSTVRFFAINRWRTEEGETISIELTPEELETIKGLATLAVQSAKEDAGRVNEDFEISDILSTAIFPGDAEISFLETDDEESLKGLLFEEKLKEVATGNDIIAIISNHQNDPPEHT